MRHVGRYMHLDGRLLMPPEPFVRLNSKVKACPTCGVRVPLSIVEPLYHNCRPPEQSRGIGDTIAKITTALGIKPCGGCKERQAKLNKILPYKTEAST